MILSYQVRCEGYKLKFLVILFFLFTTLFSNELTKVTLQLKWRNQFQFAGYYMAKEKGYYKELGLDVDIRELEFGDDVIKKVMTGEADFGIGDSSALLYNANHDLNLLFLLAAYQTSPAVLVTDVSIKKISDLKNKKIIFNNGEIDNASIDSMLYANGITQNDYTEVANRFRVDDLITHKADAMIIYASNEPYTLKKRGFKYNLFDPSDYGYEFYDDLLFTSSSYAKKYPKIVNRFYAASIKGWEYAFSHIDETIDVILKKYNTQLKTRDAYRYEADVLKKLAYKGGVKFGEINQKRFTEIRKTYDSLGFIDRFASLQDDIFVPKEMMNRNLTKSESVYIHEKRTVSMCVNSDMMPLGTIKDNQYIGIESDIMDLIEKQTGLIFKPIVTKNLEESLEFVKRKRCDILPFIIKTDENRKYMNFTSPIMDIKISFATKSDKPFINDISNLNGKTVGIVQGSGIESKIAFKYPKINIVEVENLRDGFKKVLDNELYAMADSTMRLNYLIDNDHIGKISVSGQFPDVTHLTIGVRDDDFPLYSILDKAVDSINEKQTLNIYNKWNRVDEKKVDKNKLVYNIIAVATFIILLLFFISIRLNLKLKRNLREHHQMLKTFDKNVIAVVVNLDGYIVHVSQAFIEVSGYKEKELIGSKFLKFVHNENKKEIFENIMEAVIYEDPYKIEFENIKKNGDVYWTEVVFIPEIVGHSLVGFNAIMHDITLKKEIEHISKNLEHIVEIRTQELLDKNREIEHILDTTMEGILIFHNAICINVNRSAMELGGYRSKTDLIGHAIEEFVTDEYKELVKKNMEENYTKPYEIMGIKKDGSTMPCLVKGHSFEINGRALRITTFIDLTNIKEKEAELLEVQKELQEQAHKDYLTGLYNRRYFAELAQNYMELFHRERKEACIMMIDIDFFKNINDTFGHAEGDKVIKRLVEALVEHTRHSDIIARFGGEEFVVLLPNTGVKNALSLAQKIRKNVEALEVVSDTKELIKFTISIGVAEISFDDNNIESSIKRSDDALYKAKNSGRNRVEMSD
ncbi:diguanylate cyclase [Sulfurimonas sp. HSL3-2]|uniref:diguanylate cyclase n=1 Tax=Hydrocurvibacter mobilis TaxID=3131936 RepID=UPI0031F82CAD